MIEIKPGRPYYDKWLRRVRRHFATSGHLSQAAARLAMETGGTAEDWRELLRAVMDGRETATPDLLARIEALLATPAVGKSENMAQDLLFHGE